MFSFLGDVPGSLVEHFCWYRALPRAGLVPGHARPVIPLGVRCRPVEIVLYSAVLYSVYEV